MRLCSISIAALSLLLFSACSNGNDNTAGRSMPEVDSVYTDLGGGTCEKDVDKNDPNETPYLVCSGIAGYRLIVRRVDSGRQSIDVVDGTQRVFPLGYDQFVTRHMSNLSDQAEWRVATIDGKQVPLALIVRVRAREDNDDPEKVTQIYSAVAKITAAEVCVTDRIVENAQSVTQVRGAADSAQERECAPLLPPITDDGTVIR